MLTDSILRGLNARPAVRTACLLSAGILLEDAMQLPAGLWYAATVCAVSAALLSTPPLSAANPSLQARASDLFILISFVLLGASLLSTARADHRGVVLNPASQEQRISLVGTVVAPASPFRAGYSLIVAADTIYTEGVRYSERRTVRILCRTKKGDNPPESGMRVAVRGWLERFPHPRNPGDSDYGASLAMNGIVAVIRAEHVLPMEVGAEFSLSAAVGILQERLYRWIDELHERKHAAFLKGIVLGYRADLPDELKRAFMDTGTVHILAVSGSNVALIALVFMVCTGLVRLPRSARVASTLIGLVGYMVITGGGPSIARATVMGAIVVLMTIVPRKGDVYQSLGVAAVCLLLLDPRNLFDIGFQLSFASVIWIVAGNDVVLGWIDSLPEEFAESSFLRGAVQLSGVTLMAQLGTLPITASSFGHVSLISVLVNLVVVPLSAVVLLLGVTELFFMSMIPAVAAIYAEGNAIIMEFLLNTVSLAAKIPYASVDIAIDGWVEAVLMYALLVGLLWFRRRHLRASALVVASSCLVVIVWSGTPSRNTLDWLSIDVGQGDAHLIRTPSGRHILIDAGPGEREAERAIIPVLQRLGVSRLEAIVVSHPHADHIGGLSLLLDRLSVSTLIVSDSVRLYGRADSLVRVRGTTLVRVRAGTVYRPDTTMRLYLLHPPAVDPGRGWNNNSVAVRLEYGATSLLSTGDAEEEAEEIMVRRWGTFLSSDILKLGHHGSETSTSPRFLSAVNPRVGIISAGFRNKFHHPSQARLRELSGRAVRTLETMWGGAVWLRTDGTAWTAVDWNGSLKSLGDH